MRGSNESRCCSSCAACKLLKRKCTPTCIFAPYFRSDDPNKFAKVHKVFGASNVTKILTQVPEQHRQETVNSLAFEADLRLRDPVYGCIGAIALLQTKMLELQHDLALAKARLACYANGSCSSNSYDSDSCCFDVLESCVHVNLSYGGFSFSAENSVIDSQYGYLCDFAHFPYPFKP